MATGTQRPNGQQKQQAEAEAPKQASPKRLDELTREELLAQVIDQTKMEVKYTPFGEKEPVKINRVNIRRMVANPTKKGHMPTERDIDNFIMLCKARALNPFVGDAFLIGYDSDDGPKFSLITAHQALLKRAEMHEQYDGMRGGVIVLDESKAVVRRDGALKLPSDTLIGAWATIYRKDRTHPTEVELEVGSRMGISPLWKKDPCGMLVKCVKDQGLREAFPNTLAGMYSQEEFDVMQDKVAGEQAEEIRSISARLAAKRAQGAAQAAPEDVDETSDEHSPEEASNETSTLTEEEMRPEILAFVELCGSAESWEQIADADEALTSLSEAEERVVEEAKNRAAPRFNRGKGKSKQGNLV